MWMVYEFIRMNPEIVTLAFTLINVIWAIFIYFNNHRHERNLAKLRADYEVEVDHRKRVFEHKVTKYEAYVETLDVLSKQNSNKAVSLTLKALGDLFIILIKGSQSDHPDPEQMIEQWGERVAGTLQQDSEGRNTVLMASSQLKIFASNEVLAGVAKIQELQRTVNSTTQKFCEEYAVIFRPENHEMLKIYSDTFRELDKNIKEASHQLALQMRKELSPL